MKIIGSIFRATHWIFLNFVTKNIMRVNKRFPALNSTVPLFNCAQTKRRVSTPNSWIVHSAHDDGFDDCCPSFQITWVKMIQNDMRWIALPEHTRMMPCNWVLARHRSAASSAHKNSRRWGVRLRRHFSTHCGGTSFRDIIIHIPDIDVSGDIDT